MGREIIIGMEVGVGEIVGNGGDPRPCGISPLTPLCTPGYRSCAEASEFGDDPQKKITMLQRRDQKILRDILIHPISIPGTRSNTVASERAVVIVMGIPDFS